MIGNQELIERLLDDAKFNNEIRDIAAIRIEQLVKERDELGRKLNTARYGQPDFAWSIHEEEMSDLRVKLAKAVDALRFYACGHSTPPTWYRAHTVLSEIEGDVK